MTDMRSYTKILTLGAEGTERALVGDVIVQEKVDGSQFRFGIDEDGRFRVASHHNELFPGGPCGNFDVAVQHVTMALHATEAIHRRLHGPDTWFYCEYLLKPKQNTLAYDRVPQNHLILFDAWIAGAWATRETLCLAASSLQIDVVPELYRGEITVDGLTALLATPSFLGNETVEGVVIKNYNELVAIGGRTFPLFTKLVRADFKERNKSEWKQNSGRSKLDSFIESFRTEARWRKAVQRLDESGELERSPRDIGKLMRVIAEDIRDEEGENIRAELYKLYIGDICRTAQRGAAEWYKARLFTENQALEAALDAGESGA